MLGYLALGAMGGIIVTLAVIYIAAMCADDYDDFNGFDDDAY